MSEEQSSSDLGLQSVNESTVSPQTLLTEKGQPGSGGSDQVEGQGKTEEPGVLTVDGSSGTPFTLVDWVRGRDDNQKVPVETDLEEELDMAALEQPGDEKGTKKDEEAEVGSSETTVTMSTVGGKSQGDVVDAETAPRGSKGKPVVKKGQSDGGPLKPVPQDNDDMPLTVVDASSTAPQNGSDSVTDGRPSVAVDGADIVIDGRPSVAKSSEEDLATLDRPSVTEYDANVTSVPATESQISTKASVLASIDTIISTTAVTNIDTMDSTELVTVDPSKNASSNGTADADISTSDVKELSPTTVTLTSSEVPGILNSTERPESSETSSADDNVDGTEAVPVVANVTEVNAAVLEDKADDSTMQTTNGPPVGVEATEPHTPTVVSTTAAIATTSASTTTPTTVTTAGTTVETTTPNTVLPSPSLRTTLPLNTTLSSTLPPEEHNTTTPSVVSGWK